MNNYKNVMKFNMNLLKNDELFDKRSIIWENNELYEIKDERDTNDILEGRLGEFFRERIYTQMGITIILPVVKGSKELIQVADFIDNDLLFERVSANRYLKIEKIKKANYNNKVQQIKKIEFLYQVDSQEKSNYLSCYEGLIDTKKEDLMLGRIVFLQGKDEIYEFNYAGKGNYTDILMEQNNILKELERGVCR